MSFATRSDALVNVLEVLADAGVGAVLVGGYAVSAFNARFSTDLDLVLAPTSVGTARDILLDEGFDHVGSDSKHWVYDTAVEQYEKTVAPSAPIGVDLLVNGLGCRQTQAQWSHRYLLEHSRVREIPGGTVTTTARAAEGSVLVAAKLHSARETDIRDVLAVADAIELTAVTPHLYRGDLRALRRQLERGAAILESEGLKHGFRSDFGASAVSTETVAALQSYLSKQIAQLED